MLEEEVGRVGVYFRNGRRNVSRSCAVEGSWKQTSPRQNSRRIVGYIYIHTTRSVVRKRDRERFTIVIYIRRFFFSLFFFFLPYIRSAPHPVGSPLCRAPPTPSYSPLFSLKIVSRCSRRNGGWNVGTEIGRCNSPTENRRNPKERERVVVKEN